MLLIGESCREGVFEDGHRLVEGDAVLFAIAGCFCGIEFEDLAGECHAPVL